MSLRFSTLAAFLLLAALPARAEPDSRELVQLPPVMQEHMLSNMRDHVAALDAILAAIAVGRLDEAAKHAETRLGMSSLESHGASHMAPYMPKGMQAAGTSMHQAASRLVLRVQESGLKDPEAALRDFAGALHEVTAACNACHSSYRIR